MSRPATTPSARPASPSSSAPLRPTAVRILMEARRGLGCPRPRLLVPVAPAPTRFCRWWSVAFRYESGLRVACPSLRAVAYSRRAWRSCPTRRWRTALTTWAGRIAAGEARLMAYIGEFDERRAWAVDGILSCAHWLSWRLGMGPNAAGERVRVARALRQLPETSRRLPTAGCRSPRCGRSAGSRRPRMSRATSGWPAMPPASNSNGWWRRATPGPQTPQPRRRRSRAEAAGAGADPGVQPLRR